MAVRIEHEEAGWCPVTARMTTIRKADPAARRQAVRLLAVGMVVGGLVILAVDCGRTPLRNWLLSDRADVGRRVQLVSLLVAARGGDAAIQCP